MNYLIDPTFTKFNRLFALLFENEDDRTFFLKYYVPSLETKELNVLIDTRRVFDTPIKNIKETYENIIETGRKDFITTLHIVTIIQIHLEVYGSLKEMNYQ